MSRSIVFVISSFSVSNTGQGGHYYSLKTIVRALSGAGNQVAVLSFGDIAPPALRDLDVPYKHVSDGNWRKALAALSITPTHLHAFDRRSVYFARAISSAYKSKMYITKPGGPNTNYFPFAEDIFLFSEENMSFMKDDPHLKGARLHLIPNRVSGSAVSQERVDEIRHRYPFVGLNILRIARIGSSYKRSILQTVEFAAKMRAQGVAARAVLIGAVQDDAVLVEIRQRIGADDLLLTDQLFTRNAAELLPIADIVVATGRGVMEAAIAGKPVLCPVSNDETLQLLTEDSVEDLQRANFSERASVPDPAGDTALLALSAPGTRKAVSERTRRMARERFDVDAAMETYDAIYDLPQSRAEPLRDKIYLLSGYLYALARPKLAEALKGVGARRD